MSLSELGTAADGPVRRLAPMRELRRDDELETMDAAAKADLRGNLGQQVAARRILALLDEVRFARRLVRAVYHSIPETAGDDELQADLEQYAGALGIIRAAP